jgi:hexosaminidase
MATNGLPDADHLQSWFISRIAHFLAERGRKAVGWDEILEGGLPAGAAVMSWRGTSGGIAAARAGHDVVMTPTSHCYLDYRQTTDAGEPGAPFGVLELPTAYAYEPVPAELSPSEAVHVLGTQANMWSEQMPTVDHLEYMAMPRLAALAEVAWSDPTQRDFSDFLLRLDAQRGLLDARRVNYRLSNGSAARRELRL